MGLEASSTMESKDLIAIIGIAVTLAVSVANLIYSLWSNKRTMFVNTVTASRLKWIDSLRDKVSEFIALSARLSSLSRPTDDSATLQLHRDTLLNQIALHLNPLDPEDDRIKTLAHHVRDLTTKRHDPLDLSRSLIDLRDATGAYLKKEWNRVKRESEGEQS
jgi:hypothetical protein